MIRVLLALITCAVLGCVGRIAEVDERPLTVDQEAKLRSLIRSEIVARPELAAPIVLPIRSPKFLAALMRDRIVQIRGAHQRFSVSALHECHLSAPDCREIVIGRLAIGKNVNLIDGNETPPNTENSALLSARFGFSGQVSSQSGLAGISEGYWVAYNAESSHCPARLEKTMSFIGSVLYHPDGRNFSEPVSAYPGTEVATRASRPSANEYVCETHMPK